MKRITHTVEFLGCYDGCPFCTEGGVLSPLYCMHPSFEKARKIIGYSSKSCEIQNGQHHPEWCPIDDVKEGG